MLRIVLAVLHLLALGIGLGAIYARARWLWRLGEGPDALHRALVADTWWGIAALLWIGTGIWRAVAGTEKAPSYYWHNHVFYGKMGLLVVVLLLEIGPMMTLIRWRMAEQKGMLLDAPQLVTSGRWMGRISDAQTLLVILIVIAAVLMARGYGVVA